VHHSGSGRLAKPFPWGTSTSYSLPACLAHSELGQTRRSKPTRDKSGLHLTADMRVPSFFGSRDSFTGSMRTMFHTRVGRESSRLSRTRNEQRLHVCTACHLGIRRLEVLAQFSLPDERARNNKGILQAPCLPKCSVEKGIAEIGPLGLV
jgi:hypothetical protein